MDKRMFVTDWIDKSMVERVHAYYAEQSKEVLEHDLKNVKLLCEAYIAYIKLHTDDPEEIRMAEKIKHPDVEFCEYMDNYGWCDFMYNLWQLASDAHCNNKSDEMTFYVNDVFNFLVDYFDKEFSMYQTGGHKGNAYYVINGVDNFDAYDNMAFTISEYVMTMLTGAWWKK